MDNNTSPEHRPVSNELTSLDKAQLIELLNAEFHKRQDIEAQLQQICKHLDNCQRIAHVGSWELDLTDAGISTAPVYWSNETYNILGLDPATHQPTMESFMNTVHPDDRQNVITSTQNAIRNGQQNKIECRIVLPNGTERTIIGVSEMAFDQAGNPTKVIGVTQDITDKVQSNVQLKHAHNELKTLFEKIDEVLYSVDMERYVLLQISAACEKVYGYTMDDFYSNANLWFDVIVEEDKPVIYANNEPLARGESVVQVYRIRKKSGDIRWLQSKLEPTLNQDGKLVRLDGMTSDVTNRIQAESALKDSEKRFRSLIEHSTDGIAISNLNNEITFASESLANITGYTADEVSRMQIFDSIHPEDAANLIPARQQLLNTPENSMQFTIRFRKKQGDWIWIEGISQNLLSDPAIKGIVTNYRDITERVKYEEALRQSNDHLKKTNDELDRFVYSVSHDLRAPLASILGAIEFSESETSDSEMLENLSLMKTSAQKLDGFILDILEYSRNTRTEVKGTEINFNELLHDITNNLKFMGSGIADVDIRINVENNLPLFHSDRSRISIVLNNLVSNAIRYCNPQAEHPFVQVRVRPMCNDIELTVTDNGVGIDPKHHERIFDMFFRVSKKSAGSGLGLYIVKETIVKLGGTLHFESEPDKGTTFIITLPNLYNI